MRPTISPQLPGQDIRMAMSLKPRPEHLRLASTPPQRHARRRRLTSSRREPRSSMASTSPGRVVCVVQPPSETGAGAPSAQAVFCKDSEARPAVTGALGVRAVFCQDRTAQSMLFAAPSARRAPQVTACLLQPLELFAGTASSWSRCSSRRPARTLLRLGTFGTFLCHRPIP